MGDGRMRLLVIGAGRMGRVHLATIERSHLARTVAVVEPVESTRAELSASGMATFADVDEAIAAGGFDAAVIAAPTPFHPALIAALMAARVPTLCEKPCGLRSQDTAEAARHADESGVPLQIGYWRRFVPELQALRAEIESGALGEIALIQAWQWDGEPPGAAFRTMSGGPLLDMGVHEFDMVRWLSGQELTLDNVIDSTVTSVAPVAGDPESVLAVGRLSGGGVGAISLGRRYDKGDCCWVEVIGTQGSRRCEFMVGADGERVWQAGLLAQLDAFVATVGGAPTTAASAADAVAALRVVEAGTAMYSTMYSGKEQPS